MDPAMSPLTSLARELGRAQDRAFESRALPSPPALAPIKRSNHAARAWIASVAVVAACAVALIVWRALPSRQDTTNRSVAIAAIDAHSALPGGWIETDHVASRSLRFDDQSVVQLAPNTRARVVDQDARGALVQLERGSLHVDVVHRADTRWRFEAGPFEIAVTGTAFALVWEPGEARITIRMEQGRVLVRGPHLDAPREVVAGESLSLLASVPTPVVARHADPVAAPLTPTALTVDAGSTLRSSHGTRSSTESAARPPTADELLAQADAARFARDVARARALYESVHTRFARTHAAARALFSLGRLADDVLHDAAQSATYYSQYLRENPNGSLARDARARRVEALVRDGKREQARVEAQQYLSLYPDGPAAVRMHSLLE